MTPHSGQHTPASESLPILCGILHRAVNSIGCQVDVRNDWSYELSIVPHWDPSAAMIERFAALTPALLRQAEVARQLRANGCTVIEQAAALSIHEAA